jgi:hypothetical protein
VRTSWSFIVLGAAAALAAGLYFSWPAAAPAAGQRDVREALLGELQTVTLENCTLERYGGAHDGGYLLCANLIPGVEVAYSYGIGEEDNWGCAVSREFGVAVHQYDCFTSARPACEGGRFVFHNVCVGASTETRQSREFDTIPRQLAVNGDSGKRLLVKIDVEGAEWDALMATPDAILDTIDQMAMELHGADEARFVDLIRRLKTKFYLVNLHFNNYACTADSAPLPAWAFQVLWVNKRLGVLDADGPSPAPMSPLNAKDSPNDPDCQLQAD